MRAFTIGHEFPEGDDKKLPNDEPLVQRHTYNHNNHYRHNSIQDGTLSHPETTVIYFQGLLKGMPRIGKRENENPSGRLGGVDP